MLKDMDCQRVPVEGTVTAMEAASCTGWLCGCMAAEGAGAGCAGCVTGSSVAHGAPVCPSTEQAPAAPQKKAGHSVNTPTNSLLYALWSEWNDIQVGVNAFDYVLNLPLEDGRNGRQLLNDEESKTALTQIKLKLMNLASSVFGSAERMPRPRWMLCHVCFYQKTKWWHGCFSFRRPAAANQPPWIALSILFAKQASYSG